MPPRRQERNKMRISTAKSYANGDPKPFSPRRIALSRGVFAHSYIHTKFKYSSKHSQQTDSVTLKSYVDLADAYASLGQFDIAEEKYRSALNVYNGSIHDASIISRCLCGLGAVCTNTQRFDEAKRYLHLGLKFLASATKSAKDARNARKDIDDIVLNDDTLDGVHDDILQNVSRDLDEWQFADLMKARTYGHLAELCRAEGDVHGIIKHLNQAIDTMSAVEKSEQIESYTDELGHELLRFYYQLGTIYITQKSWHNVISNYESALDLVEKQFGTYSVSIIFFIYPHFVLFLTDITLR